jgi:hypothetical protein
LLQIDEVYFHRAASKLQNEPVNLGEIYYERTRFARDLALFFREKDPERANDYWNKANEYLDRAAEEWGKSVTLTMQQANLLETRACLYILRGDKQMGDDIAAGKLLDEATALMQKHTDMPSYAHVVAGKIELQRGLILLHQRRVQEALRAMAIALARAYLFAPTHRDQQAFEQLITDWVRNRQIALEEVSEFVRSMSAGNISVKASDLRYLPPLADDWLIAWERSFKYFEALQRPMERMANDTAV